MGKQEAEVEKYLHDRVKYLGGVTRKFVSPGHAGVADRLVFLPGGELWLVEVKTIDGEEEPAQRRERVRMSKLGFKTAVVHGQKGVNEWISKL